MRDFGVRGPRPIEFRRIEGWGSEAKSSSPLRRSGNRFARQRRLKKSWRTGRQHGRRPGGVVHMTMIRVSVPTLCVVADGDIHGLVVKNSCDSSGHIYHRLCGEARRVVTEQSGVGVTEFVDRGDTKALGRRVQFMSACLGEVLGEVG